MALRERGFEIIEAASTASARWRSPSQWVPDIVVLDALMPGLDGFETCRRCARLPGFEHVPVLMLTGLDDDASIARAYEAGATDFFVKATQWSLLAGGCATCCAIHARASNSSAARPELARAQDLARMGSFDWRRGEKRGLMMSARGAARVRPAAAPIAVSLRKLLRLVP
jgi:PleD family two-component response regulator